MIRKSRLQTALDNAHELSSIINKFKDWHPRVGCMAQYMPNILAFLETENIALSDIGYPEPRSDAQPTKSCNECMREDKSNCDTRSASKYDNCTGFVAPLKPKLSPPDTSAPVVPIAIGCPCVGCQPETEKCRKCVAEHQGSAPDTSAVEEVSCENCGRGYVEGRETRTECFSWPECSLRYDKWIPRTVTKE